MQTKMGRVRVVERTLLDVEAAGADGVLGAGGTDLGGGVDLMAWVDADGATKRVSAFG